MTVRVKICGVNSEAAFDACAQAGVDWIGFNFFARSPRHVTPATAATLSHRLPGGPARVGLFVNPTDDEVAGVLDALPLHALQLYAPAPRVGALRARFDVPVWRAVGVETADDLPEGAGAASCLVIEPRAPAGAERPGGNATVMDWTMLAGWEPGAPWLLAGGLTSGNVGRAILQSGARAVDVSSGVESAPGVKDPGLIASFAAQARAIAV